MIKERITVTRTLFTKLIIYVIITIKKYATLIVVIVIYKEKSDYVSINFIKEPDCLIMEYTPYYGIDQIQEKIEKEGVYHLKNLFYLSNPIRHEDYYEDSLYFVVGTESDGFYKLDKDIFGIKHNVYIEKKISITYKLFVANRNISIIRHIDNLVDSDIYISTDWIDKKGYLPYDEFKELVKFFPNSIELTKYSNARISLILRNYFDHLGQKEADYETYLNKKGYPISTYDELRVQKIQLFEKVYYDMIEMLKNASAYNEANWQEKVCKIVCMIYPKYILAKREMIIGSDGRHKKKPDFILVDSTGYVDILEIKKPNDMKIMTKTEYRNNYVADRDLSGAILQIEKYVYCLNKQDNYIDRLKVALKKDLPENLTVNIINPQGMLLMGRSNDLSPNQLEDFEIIKRQHKNIVDIMTYDDLLNRLKNIIEQLKKSY